MTDPAREFAEQARREGRSVLRSLLRDGFVTPSDLEEWQLPGRRFAERTSAVRRAQAPIDGTVGGQVFAVQAWTSERRRGVA